MLDSAISILRIRAAILDSQEELISCEHVQCESPGMVVESGSEGVTSKFGSKTMTWLDFQNFETALVAQRKNVLLRVTKEDFVFLEGVVVSDTYIFIAVRPVCT